MESQNQKSWSMVPSAILSMNYWDSFLTKSYPSGFHRSNCFLITVRYEFFSGVLFLNLFVGSWFCCSVSRFIMIHDSFISWDSDDSGRSTWRWRVQNLLDLKSWILFTYFGSGIGAGIRHYNCFQFLWIVLELYSSTNLLVREDILLSQNWFKEVAEQLFL